jgi:adenosine kinase
MNVVIVGSLAYDYIMNVSGTFSDRIMEEKIHSISLSFLVDSLKKQLGGTAGNIAYSLKLLTITPLIVSEAGNDFSLYKKFLKKNRISTTYIQEYDDVSTSLYVVLNDKANNEIRSFYTGATRYATTHSILSVKEIIHLVIIAPTNPKAMTNAVRDCISKHIPYIYDPSFHIAALPKEELEEGVSHAAILIGNDYEIGLIEEKLEIPHEELVATVPALVTTLGSKGSIIETRTQSMYIKPAIARSHKDPRGAGSAYRAGFIAGYLRGYPLDICGQMGSVAAAYTVELYGTQTHTFTTNEFVKRYIQNYNLTIQL